MLENWTRSTREKHLNKEYEAEEWKKYDWCSFFKNMIAYLRQELKRIEELFKQKRKIIINQSFKYFLAFEKSLFMYHEKNDRKSSCLTKNQIDSILKHLHDDHEHYSHVITLNRMKDEAYWSTRTQDVIIWCKSCSACQLNVNKHLTAVIKHVLTFEFMFMIELNFLDSIKSACSMTKCRYILLKMNYFNRFVWTRFYVYCTMIESTDLMNNLIALIFEWFKIVYFDNEKHFTEFEFEKLLKTREVMHFTTFVNHSSSMNLIERMIQLMIENIKKRCIQRRNWETWALNVIDETIVINIRKIKIHEHKSCDIMLRFVSKIIQYDTIEIESVIWKNEMKKLSNHAQNIMIILRAENKILALKIMIKYQNKKKNEEKRQRSDNKIKKRDLILIKDKVKYNQKEKKLNVKWKEFRMIMFKIKHDLNAWVKSLYDVEKFTKYHINDLRSWVKRKLNDQWSITQLVSEFSSNQDAKKNEDATLMITVRANEQIDSFRASLTFEMKREAMIFASYSDQRSLLL